MIEISVCIPVYKTEKLLERCLYSVLSQDFSKKEIIVVNDGSKNSYDSKNRNCSKIVSDTLKNSNVNYKYIERPNNMGLLEARRCAVMNAAGNYIYCLDSDDFIENDSALTTMFVKAQVTNADILNALAIPYTDYNSKRIEIFEQKLKTTELGELNGIDILKSYIVREKHLGYLWAKLIKKSVYIQALKQIPSMNCTMNEDLLQYFFIALFSKKYFGISNKVYAYSIDEGISNKSKILTLEECDKICSCANALKTIQTYIRNSSNSLIDDDIKDAINRAEIMFKNTSF